MELLKFLYDLFHAGPHSSIFFNTPQYQPTKLPVCDKSHLLFTTFQNWNISCAHFTEEDAKAVNINLNEKKMHSSPFPENKLTLPKSIPHSPKFSCTWTTCRKTPISVHHLDKKKIKERKAHEIKIISEISYDLKQLLPFVCAKMQYSWGLQSF